MRRNAPDRARADRPKSSATSRQARQDPSNVLGRAKAAGADKTRSLPRARVTGYPPNISARPGFVARRRSSRSRRSRSHAAGSSPSSAGPSSKTATSITSAAVLCRRRRWRRWSRSFPARTTYTTHGVSTQFRYFAPWRRPLPLQPTATRDRSDTLRGQFGQALATRRRPILVLSGAPAARQHLPRRAFHLLRDRELRRCSGRARATRPRTSAFCNTRNPRRRPGLADLRRANSLVIDRPREPCSAACAGLR